MIILDSGEGREPTFLDPSGYSCWRRCPARYCFRYILGFCTTQPMPALNYGTAIHSAMPFLQRKDLNGGLDAFQKSWLSSGNEEDSKRNISCGIKMLTRWYKERIVSETLPYKMLEPPQTGVKPTEAFSDQEFAYATSLCKNSLLFCGRIDGLGQNRATNKPWIIEYKTTSELAARFVNAWKLSSQLIAYVLAGSIVLGETIEGAFLEALRVTAAEQKNLCIPVFVEEEQIEGFIWAFKKTSQEISQAYEEKTYLQDFSACSPYAQFGSQGYLCEYEVLCSSLDWRCNVGAFEISHWSPFEELNEQPNKNLRSEA